MGARRSSSIWVSIPDVDHFFPFLCAPIGREQNSGDNTRKPSTLLTHLAFARFLLFHPPSSQLDEALLAPDSRVSSISINDEEQPKKSLISRITQKVFKGDMKVALYALGLLVASTGNSIMFKKSDAKKDTYSNQRAVRCAPVTHRKTTFC